MSRARRRASTLAPLGALAAAVLLCAVIPSAPAWAYTEVKYADAIDSGWGQVRASSVGTIVGGRIGTSSTWTVHVDTWRPDADFVVWSATGRGSVAGTHPAYSSVKSRCWWTYDVYVSGTVGILCWKRV